MSRPLISIASSFYETTEKPILKSVWDKAQLSKNNPKHELITPLFLHSDNLILRLAKAAGEVLGKTHDELMYAFGVYMVKRIGNYGYERILKVM